MKLAVIGVGLIGGSFALALKKAKAVSHVVGVGRGRQNLQLARDRVDDAAFAPDAAMAAKDEVRVLRTVSADFFLLQRYKSGHN